LSAATGMVEIAREAGALLVEYFVRAVSWRYKGERDPVSDADLACEALIVRALRIRFPLDGIVTEEGTLHQSQSGARWWVDPLDGTKNFLRGNPCFSVTLALERDGAIVAGVVFDPMRGELFAAERNAGSFCNGGPIGVSRTPHLCEALITSGFPSARRHRDIDPRFAHHLSMATQGVRRSGSTALDLAYVAAGRLDAFWDCCVAPWDIAAGSLLVTEAGGRCTQRAHGLLASGQGGTLASNAILHDELTEYLNWKAEPDNHFAGSLAK
jgi:myo-inositol-1(or 4)-monophosphatase